MRIKTSFKALLLLSLAACALAGWERTYGGSEEDYGYSVAHTSDGGYIVAGMTYSFGTGDDEEPYLIKTDSLGNTIWTRVYSGIGSHDIYSIAKTSDGGYIVVGDGWTYSTSDDVFVIKTNASGDTLWTRTYGGSEDEDGYSVAQTFDGGYIVVGYTNSFGAGWSSDVYLLKLSSSGDTVWTRTYGGSGYDLGFSVAQTTDGGYIVAGRTTSFGAGGHDVYLLRLDSDGDTVWTRTYGGSDDDYGYSVVQTTDNGFIVAGYTSTHFYLIKTNPSGDTIWTRTYNGISNDHYRNSVVQTFDGGFIVAGNSVLFGIADVYLVRTNLSGDTLWTRTYGGSYYDLGLSVAQTTDGGYIIAGWTNSFGAGGADVYLIKTDSLGYTSIGESPSARPEALAVRAYPNPFNSACQIRIAECGMGNGGFQNPNSKIQNLEIFDINGRMVASPSPSVPLPGGEGGGSFSHWEKVSEGRMRAFIWQPDESLGSGIYLVRIKGTNAAAKIIYLK